MVNKPPGQLTQADSTGDLDLLTECKAYIKARFEKPGNVFLGMVHRLDRPASGLVVFARTSKAAARLTHAFKQRAVYKRYLAIVCGGLPQTQILEDLLVRDERSVSVARVGTEGAQQARLKWSLVATRGDLSLVEVMLETGRKHQIRVQFANRQAPLLGDMRYGCTRPFDGRNLALHAVALELPHPTTRQTCRWVVAPPNSWSDHFKFEVGQVVDRLASTKRLGQFV